MLFPGGGPVSFADKLQPGFGQAAGQRLPDQRQHHLDVAQSLVIFAGDHGPNGHFFKIRSQGLDDCATVPVPIEQLTNRLGRFAINTVDGNFDEVHKFSISP